MRTAIIYIDGRNLYHSLESCGIDAFNFDYSGFVKKIVGDRQCLAIKFYCAHYPAKLDKNRNNRDHALYQNLNNNGILTIFGKFKIRNDQGRQFPIEKGVDVLLATDLIFDAFFANSSGAQDFYVFSEDTDILPAIKKVKLQFSQLKFYACQFNSSGDWRRTCDGTITLFSNVAKKFSNHRIEPTTATLKALEEKFKK